MSTIRRYVVCADKWTAELTEVAPDELNHACHKYEWIATVRRLAQAAFRLYMLEWSGNATANARIDQWLWPFKQLKFTTRDTITPTSIVIPPLADAFPGDEPWQVLLRHAVAVYIRCCRMTPARP